MALLVMHPSARRIAIPVNAIATITGYPGVGKTCVLRALRHVLGNKQAFQLTYCHSVTPRDAPHSRLGQYPYSPCSSSL